VTKSKAELRVALQAARSSLGTVARFKASEAAARFLAKSSVFQAAQTVALYAAFRDEADPIDLEALALSTGGEIVYPRVEGSELVFKRATRDTLVRGSYGIYEPPENAPAVWLEAIDLFVVPGLGFTERGDRLGYGLGFYDRLLTRTREAKRPGMAIGFAFSCQIVDAIPSDDRDQKLDGLVTENGLSLVV
jgi:5-formyltetrahydrofolate cyclo-ligase